MQLQLCFGISIRSLRDVKMEGSDWHSKRLLLVSGRLCTHYTPTLFGNFERKGKDKKEKSRIIKRFGQMMQERGFHCHVVSKEMGVCTFGTAYSISARFVHSWSPENKLHRCVLCCCLHIPDQHYSSVLHFSTLSLFLPQDNTASS